MDNQQKRSRNNSEHSERVIFLEIQPANKVGEQWEFSVIVRVKVGKYFLPNQSVKFLLNGEEKGHALTKGGGVVSKKFTVSTTGNYTVTAILDNGTLDSGTIPIQEEKKRGKPDYIIIDEVPVSQDKILLVFQVFTEDEKPVPGVIIRVLETGKGSYDLDPTDNKGATQKEFERAGSEKQKLLQFIVLGTEIREWKKLVYAED